MPAEKISLDAAKNDKLFYFVATAVVYRKDDGRCLILKRDDREKVHPGRYGVPGGKLEWGDLDLKKVTRTNGDVLDFEHAAEKLIAREVREEAGIEIELPLRYLDSTAFIRPDGVPVMLIKFAALYASGEIVLEQGAFTDHAWVTADEAKEYLCIDGIVGEIAATIEVFNRQ